MIFTYVYIYISSEKGLYTTQSFGPGDGEREKSLQLPIVPIGGYTGWEWKKKKKKS